MRTPDHLFHEKKEICGATPGDSSHSIDQTLIFDPDGDTSCAHDRFRKVALLLADGITCKQTRRTGLQHGGGIRHRPHDGAVVTKPVSQVFDADTGGDGEHQRAVFPDSGGKILSDIGHDLWLDRQHNDICSAHGAGAVRGAVDIAFCTESVEFSPVGIHGDDPFCRMTIL